MSKLETATAFFHACESFKGWSDCQQYVAAGAAFSAQSEPLVDVDTVEGYTEWLAAMGHGPLRGSTYSLDAAGYDEANDTVICFGTFHAVHSGEGGPVPASGKKASSEFVYVFKMDSTDKIAKMTKVWNAPWALTELGWM